MNNYNKLSDQDLIAKLQSGDELAFGSIYEKFYAALCFFSLRLISDKSAAEDIVQEIMCKLWQKHADFNNKESIKAFLYISTRNACLNYLVKERRKEKHHLQLSQLPLDESEINEVIYAEALREIVVELDYLPVQCAKVLKMMYHEGLKPQEIADKLQITVSTVYNQKMRGIAILRKRLSGHSYEIFIVMLMADLIK